MVIVDSLGTIIVAFEITVIVVPLISEMVIVDSVGIVISTSAAATVAVTIVPVSSEMVIVDSVGIVILAFVIWGRNAIVK